ncbi:hypothetical protein BDR04DRAFT_747593 [Suillus decipiens]|nr:hypothetical protein BDR04DRAFT_747593 [Suillus decipiens]
MFVVSLLQSSVLSVSCPSHGPQKMEIDVPTWRAIIFSSHLSSQCRLKYMTYCKCKHEKEHEFLLFEFCHLSASPTTILVVDRTANTELQKNNNGSSSPIHLN